MDIWDMLLGTDPNAIQQNAQAAQRNLGIQRGMQTLGSFAAGRAKDIGEVAGRQAAEDQGVMERGAQARYAQTGPLAQARAALEAAQTQNIPLELQEREREARQREALGWAQLKQMRLQPINGQMGDMWVFNQKDGTMMPANVLAEAMAAKGLTPGRGSPRAAPPSVTPPGAQGNAAPAPPPSDEPLLRGALKDNPQAMSIAEQHALATLPPQARTELMSTPSVIAEIDRAIQKVRERPQAFGYTRDISGIPVIGKQLQQMRQNDWPQEDLDARTAVMGTSLQSIHKLAGARGMNPNQENYMTQRYAVSSQDSAEAAEAKLINQRNEAATSYNQLKNLSLPQLHNHTTDIPMQTPILGKGKGATEGKIRVRLKSTGQAGKVPANEFDPNLYEKIE